MANLITPSISSEPCVSRFAVNADTSITISYTNPITLPLIPFKTIGPTFGKKISQGTMGVIYNVRDKPGRIYKTVIASKFPDGDEIRISDIAGRIGIGPAFHGACVVQQNRDQFVVMEMDFAGKSLKQWGEEFAQEPDSRERQEDELTQTTEDCDELAIGTKLSQVDHSPIVRRPVLPMEETVDKLYGKQEPFYFELFNNIKMLAENNIAYTDCNWGNIIPNIILKDRLKLIDFGSAKLMTSVSEAARRAVHFDYGPTNFRTFAQLPDLSPESVALIDWYRGHLKSRRKLFFFEQNG